MTCRSTAMGTAALLLATASSAWSQCLRDRIDPPFYSTVATLLSVDRESMLERILRLNLHATATGGGSLDLSQIAMTLCCHSAGPGKWSDRDFGTLLGNFIALAMQLKTSLAPAGAVPPVDSRQTSDLLLNLQWRA